MDLCTPPQKLIYSLFVSKILTPALTPYPRAAKRCVCQSRFHHPSLFFLEIEYVEKKTVGLNPAFCVVDAGALLLCAVLHINLFCSLYLKKMLAGERCKNNTRLYHNITITAKNSLRITPLYSKLFLVMLYIKVHVTNISK